jgi:hypothetical protein
MKKSFLIIVFLLLITTLVSQTGSVQQQEKAIRISIVLVANSCIGIKYTFNGTTPAGFDNSGFTKYVYYKNNIELPRSVDKQFRAGKKINPSKAQPGDLIFFFDDPDRKMEIGHVGIYLGQDKFIHMPGEGSKVRIDRIKKGSVYAKRFAAVCSYRDIYTVPVSSTENAESRQSSNPNPASSEEERMFDEENY